MNLELNDKVCLVTGASVGIGRGIASFLAGEGGQLVLVARRERLLRELAEEIERAGGKRPLVVPADLYDRGSPERIRARVEEAFGRLDVLVNNAGGSRPLSRIDGDDEVWDESFAINFTAGRRLTNAFIAGMRGRKWGRVINITGSDEPTMMNAGQAPNGAVHIWAKALSRLVAADGITVNSLVPGRIMSEQITKRLHPTEESRRAFAQAHIPAGYFGEPKDMAGLIAFLASPHGRYITGQVIYVDGGMRRFPH
ncbi:MAG: SDR family oxidoreductase [Proteobacteria bacterium]|nr:SDR family oxidoreductase [Pseudomonadota bacterium]